MITRDELAARVRDLAGRIRAFAPTHRIGWRHGAATGAVLVAAVAVMGLARGAAGREATGLDAAHRLKIEVVQPVEPQFISGPVMDVGTLVDGFDPSMIPPSAPSYDDPVVVEADYDAPPDKRPEGFFRRFSTVIEQALPVRDSRPAPRIRRDDPAYGFDAEGPDWKAEREARRAWRERIEAERRADREARDAQRQARREWQSRGDRGPERRSDDAPTSYYQPMG